MYKYYNAVCADNNKTIALTIYDDYFTEHYVYEYENLTGATHLGMIKAIEHIYSKRKLNVAKNMYLFIKAQSGYNNRKDYLSFLNECSAVYSKYKSELNKYLMFE